MIIVGYAHKLMSTVLHIFQQFQIAFLVGERVDHTFDEGKLPGYVMSVVSGWPQWYHIKYDGDESVHTYKLLEDYAAQNLLILD